MSEDLALLVLRAAIMLAVSGAIAALAIAIAHALALRRRFLADDAPSPDQTIEQLVRTAQTARSQGLIRAEATLDQTAHPALRHGLRQAIAGLAPHALRDAAAAAIELHARPYARHALALGAVVITGTLLVLAWSALIAMSATSSLTLPASLLKLAAIVAISSPPILAWVAFRSDREQSLAASRELNASMTIEALTLIAAGAQAEDVRRSLLALLPPSQRRISDLPSARAA